MTSLYSLPKKSFHGQQPNSQTPNLVLTRSKITHIVTTIFYTIPYPSCINHERPILIAHPAGEERAFCLVPPPIAAGNLRQLRFDREL